MFSAAGSRMDGEDKNTLSTLLLSIINRENVVEQPNLKQLGKDVVHHILDLPNALPLNDKAITRIRLIISLASCSLHLILYTDSKEKLIYPVTYEEYMQLNQAIISEGAFIEKIENANSPVFALTFWTEKGYELEVQDFYDQFHKKLLNLFISSLPPDKETPLTIIELGCGNARLLGSCYAAAKEKGYEVLAIGIDPNVGKLKDYQEENPYNEELQLFQQDASSAPDILASNFPHIHLGKVFCLLSGYLTTGVSSGSKEALQLLTSIYDKVDVLLWGGLTSPLLTKKSLTPNFHITLDSYDMSIIYKLIKKTFSEKMLYYRKKLSHKNRLDLSHEFTPVVDIIDALSQQDKLKIAGLILIDANIQNASNILDRLSQFQNLKEVYFEISQLKKLKKQTPHFIEFFINNKIEIKLLNSHDKCQTTYLSVSEVEKVNRKVIVNFFESAPNCLLNNRKTLIEHLNIARELLKLTHQDIDKCHKFYYEFMNLYGILSDPKFDSNENLKSWNMLFRLGTACTNTSPTQVFGNKYDNAIFFLKNLSDPLILITTFNALTHSYDICRDGYGLTLFGIPYHHGQMHKEFLADDEAIIDLTKIMQNKHEKILERNAIKHRI